MTEDFFIGQIFEIEYPPEAAIWCNQQGNCHIEEAEVTDGILQFKIVKNPQPTLKEEKERIKQLSMTKLDFVNSLDEYGVTYYDHILPLLNANLEAKKQWDLCNHVFRGNPLLDELGQELNITSEQLDEIFKKRGQ